MHRRPNSSRLAVAWIASALVHVAAAAVLVPWDTGRERDPRAHLELRDPPPPDAPQPPTDLRLGSDTSTATSITWIGYDEYQEHVSDPSVVDQPELTRDPAQGQPEPTQPTPPSQPTPPTPPSRSLVQTTPPVTETPAPAIEPAPIAETAAAPVQTEPAESLTADESREQPPPTEHQSDQETPADNQSKTEQSEPPTPEPAPPSPTPEPTPAIEPVPPTPPTGSSEEPGEHADRESTASSVLTAKKEQLGKPLAGEGLEIQTVRPRFTHYTRLMAAPRQPRVRIDFRRDGRVEHVELLRSSGVADVDRPLLDAIYQWRATGKKFESLPTSSGEKPTVLSVEIRILL